MKKVKRTEAGEKTMSTVNSHEYEVQVLKKTEPLMRWDGKQPIAQWKEQAREKLMQLLGLPLERCDADLDVEEETEKDTYREIRFTVQTEPGYRVPCYLLVPKQVQQPIPMTVCLSGHGGGMHVVIGKAKKEADEHALAEWPHRAMGLRAVKDGRCALVVEARNFGESSLEGYGTSCTEAAKIALLMGRTVIGERVWDVMRILDAVAAHFPCVDMAHIVCTGNSGGGTATYYLACLEERIAAAAPSCAVCTYEESIAAMPHCLCNHIPGIRKYFEMGDLAGLIAPRTLVIAAGKEDTTFPITGTQRAFDEVKRMYAAQNVQERCALVIGEKGHYNYADLIWEKLDELGAK